MVGKVTRGFPAPVACRIYQRAQYACIGSTVQYQKTTVLRSTVYMTDAPICSTNRPSMHCSALRQAASAVWADPTRCVVGRDRSEVMTLHVYRVSNTLT